MKYPRTYHWPSSPGLQNDDRIATDLSKIIDKPIVITEKIDGSNTCLHNGQVYGRSHLSPSHDGWRSMVWKYHSWKTVNYPNFKFFGEDIYGVHNIKYDPVRPDQTFRLFAVLDLNRNIFLSLEGVLNWAIALDIPHAPILFRGQMTENEINSWLETNIKYSSYFGPLKEGFVIRNINEFPASEFDKNVVKYVRKNHIKPDQEHWTRSWKACELLKN